ncbi:hypothetical protein ACLB2K_003803 [Fragaria x ananassa]
MPPRRRPRVATSTNANEGDEIRGLVDSIGSMLRGVLDRVQQPRSVKKKDVFDVGAIEFKGAKGPLDAYNFLDAVTAAMAIETRRTYSARPRDFGGPSQGPSKRAASSSASGSSAVGESELCGSEIIHDTNEKIKVVRDRLKVAQSRQKSYADVRKNDLEFQVGDWVFLKLSSWKGVVRFGKREKLSPRYIGPYEIIERVGSLAYRLVLPPELSRIHNVFDVSMLHKYIADPSHVLEEQPISLQKDLSYEEELVQILDRKEQVLRNKTISLVKVLWRSHQVEEATWESNEQMRQQYPYLFE